MAEPITALSEEHYEAMEMIEDGATVFDYSLALRLREVQAFIPDAIDIIPTHELQKVVGEEGVTTARGHRAYFGAQLTKLGKEMVEQWEGGTL